MIHYEIDLALFGVEEARRNLILKDPQAQFAHQQFGGSAALTELARNTPRTGGRYEIDRAFGPQYFGGQFDLAPSVGAC